MAYRCLLRNMVRDGHLQEKHFDRGQGDRFDRGAAHQLAGFCGVLLLRQRQDSRMDEISRVFYL